MIIPIFFPMRCDHDDNDNKHGYDCECSKCKERKKYDAMPRKYYTYRYAIPKKWKFKNNMIKILRIVLVAIGFATIFIPMVLPILDKCDYSILFSVLLGAIIIVVSYIGLDNHIKEDYNCPQAIYLRGNSKYGNTDWDKLKKDNNVPENYCLSEIKETWSYI